MRYFISVILIFFITLLPHDVVAMTVEQAYKAIPHDRTLYRSDRSPLEEEKKIYLKNIFELTDQAVVLRVELLGRMYHEKDYVFEEYETAYQQIINTISTLDTPQELRQTETLIVQAITDQLMFFRQWHEANGWKRLGFKMYTFHQLVKKASTNLISAYNNLIAIFPHESKHNKKAFFDHLCALDFI